MREVPMKKLLIGAGILAVVAYVVLVLGGGIHRGPK
jgi:hypothetical protein